MKITLLDLGGVVFQTKGKSSPCINWDIIHVLNNKYGKYLDLGVDSFSEFIAEYNIRTKQAVTGQEFLKELYDTLDFNQELIDFVSKDSEIMIVSDNYRENIEYISRRYHFDQWATRQFYSFEYQLYKSNPDFFKKLLLDIRPHTAEQLVLIDDSQSKLESASRNDIAGILFQSNDQVKQACKNLRIH